MGTPEGREGSKTVFCSEGQDRVWLHFSLFTLILNLVKSRSPTLLVNQPNWSKGEGVSNFGCFICVQHTNPNETTLRESQRDVQLMLISEARVLGINFAMLLADGGMLWPLPCLILPSH